MAISDMRMVRVGDLIVHPVVQRDRRDHWVATLKAEFDPLGIGVLTAFEDEFNHLLIVDGAHRHTMLLELELDDMRVPVNVYSDLTLEDEAKIFRMLNKRLPVNQHDSYRLGMIEGVELDLKVTELVESFGWKIGSSRTAKVVSSIGTLKAMYRRDSDATRFAFRAINSLYPSDNDASDSRILHGFWYFYRYNAFQAEDEIPTRSRRKILSSFPTAQELIRLSYNYKRRNRTSAQAVAEALRITIE